MPFKWLNNKGIFKQFSEAVTERIKDAETFRGIVM